MKKILIVSHFTRTPANPGTNRFIYLADWLSENGHDVEIVTSTFEHSTKKQKMMDVSVLKETPYKYTMLHEPKYRKNVSLRRFYSHYVLSKNIEKYLETVEKPDIVYVAIPSNSVGEIAAKYCKKNNISLVVDIQDLWPEAFKLVFKLPVVSDLFFAPMAMQANKIYTQADKVIAVSETYAKRGLTHCKKDACGTVVFLGTELEGFDKSAEEHNIEKPENQLWITYVGTLGHSYNIEIVIDALKLLPGEITENLVFKVLGDGPLADRFKKYAWENGVCVDFLGRRDYGEMVAYLKKSDIAVNPISKGAAQSIINKHGDYAMAGLPVISTQESPEYRALLEEYGCGINCSVDSPQEVAQAIEKLVRDEALRHEMGANSRKLGEEKFDRKQTYKNIVEIIESI